ncbi:AAA family ATPase [Flavobacterium sp.]|uniref:ATP-dependent nuclease n=1 Tax=Flavobacterium sp. TaxID=239 RepID=UPI00286AF252|nr:AAA family ATPase [Flavobacterium sp.]
MKFDKLEIKNFKCFDEDGCVFENLKPINIIIGKNNSGKSSLIELIKFLTTKDKSFFENKRNGKTPQIIFEHHIRKDLINQAFPANTSGGDIGGNHNHYGLAFENSILKYEINENNLKIFLSVDKEFKAGAREYFKHYCNLIPSPLENKIFSHLSAERDILPEPQNSAINLNTTGIGATNLIQQIINRDIFDSDLIEKKLLNELNIILNPDIYFSRILIQQNDQNIWEIYFENNEDGRIPLSKMGSGVKTVLLVLILLIVKPIIDNRNVSDYVFALEELENNLHPSMQRRLYYYLFDFSKKNNCILFLTTHSNIVIDLYNSLETTQIFHINKIEGKTKISSILKQIDFKKILDDLDVRASDILQSNGIIWVEGPSDRTYLNKWLSLLDNSLVEGYHYSIMFYGGRLLSNLSFDYDLINDELIPLLKLNTNSFVVMDRDGKTISQKLNDTKLRIQSELGNNNVWVTKGREIENYLSNNSIKEWIDKNYKIKSNFENEINTKLEESISSIANSEKIKYNLNKNKYASEIIQFIKKEDLNILDLNSNISNLVETIKKWNKI